MNRKVLFFIALFYFLTVVAAFVMAEEGEEPFEAEIPELQELEEEKEQEEPEIVLPDDPSEKGVEEEIKVEEDNRVILEEVSQKESPQSWGFTLMGGTYRPERYRGRGNDLFANIYQDQSWFLKDRGAWGELALEWQFFRLFGTLAAKITGSTWYIEADHDPKSVRGTTKRKYRLFAVPATLGGVYRLHFWSNQPIIPFAEGGGGFVTFHQLGAEEDEYRNISRQIYVAGVGVQINANLLDPRAARSFDINWGVNRTHFIAQYRVIRSPQKGAFDFSGQDLITAGLLFEF